MITNLDDAAEMIRATANSHGEPITADVAKLIAAQLLQPAAPPPPPGDVAKYQRRRYEGAAE